MKKNIVEDAIIYATELHRGKLRKAKNMPYILHPLEVAQIISTMTDDQEVIAAGVLHDVVEDTDGTLDEITEKFGERVAALVDSETENKYPGEDKSESWKKRKDESLRDLKSSGDIGVKMLWLADKLSNIRSVAGRYSESGDEVWQVFHQKDPMMHRWYYMTVAQYIEYDLNRTGAYKEFIKHINFIWPGTFDSDKTRYRKYKEMSVEGCPIVGHGAKGDVYRIDDELVIKVYNENNTYADVEREIDLCKKAFVMGMPTVISFGIVAVGKRYGAMFELVNSPSVSRYIATDPSRVDYYAKMMANVAHSIHDIDADEGVFPDANDTLRSWVNEGIAYIDEELAGRILRLIDALPPNLHLVHGDFHTGNVLMQESEPMIVDLDRLCTGHPILDLSTLYMGYVANGEEDPEETRKFMGFSKETARQFYDSFMKEYFKDKDDAYIERINNEAALMCYARGIRKIRKKNYISDEGKDRQDRFMRKIRKLIDKVDTLTC